MTHAIRPGHLGRARIDGDNWQVRLQDGRPLREGDEVEIIGYESIVLVAVPIKG